MIRHPVTRLGLKHSARGFLLVEAALALALSSAMIFYQLKDKQVELVENVGEVQGQQLKKVGDAINAYAVANHAAILNNTPVAGVADVRKPSVPELAALGFLPNGFQDKTFSGGTYKSSLSLVPSGCVLPNCQVAGYVTTSTPFLLGGSYQPAAIGKAVMAAGVDAGASTLNGASIDWNNGSGSIANPIAGQPKGILAIRVGADSIEFSHFLRRDGSLPMTGALDMGEKAINNAGNITSGGNVSAGSYQVSGATVVDSSRNLVNIGAVYANAGVYTNDWLRNNNADTGLINQVTGNQLYSSYAGNWTVKSSVAGGGELRFLKSDNTRAGYIYHDASSFGLLASDGNWRIRTAPGYQELYGTTYENVTQSNLYYDRANNGYYMQPSATSNFNAIVANEIYSNSWLRNNNNGTGLYNQANGNHWYSDGAYWNAANSPGYGYGGIVMRQGYGGAPKGYLYWDSAGSGLLNNGGQWAVRANNGGGYAGGSLYGAWDASNLTIAGNQVVHAGNSANYMSGGVVPYVVNSGISGSPSQIMLGRSARNGVYNYTAYTDPNAPTTFLAAVGFGAGAGGSAEIGVNWVDNNGMWYRSLRDCCQNWSGWTRMLDSGNYNSYAPTLTGGGASGTWNIDVIGRAGKLSSINSNPDNSHPGYGANVFYSWNQGQANNPSGGYSNGITIGSHPGNTAYGFQIVQNMWDERTYTRRYNGGWQGWRTLLTAQDDPFAYNMNQYVRTTDSVTFSEIYSNSWLRNNNNGTGLYNQANGNHWYSDGAYWNAANSPGYGYGGIVMRQGYGGAPKGYLHWDGDGSGLLNNSGSWAVRANNGGGYAGGTLYGTWDASNLTIAGNQVVHAGNLAQHGLHTRYTNRAAITGDTNYHTGTNGWGTNEGTWANAWKYGFGGVDIWGTGTDHPQGAGYIHAQGIVSGMHYALSDGSAAYGWMMVGATNALENRYWLRGKWGGGTSGWVEMLTTGNYNSYAPTLTGGGASGAWNIDVTGRAARLSSAGSNPDNSHPGYGANVFYSWNQGQANNPSAGFSNGITIGSHPGDPNYGFQVVQNMWDDNLYFRRYNYGWQGWRRALNNVEDTYAANMNQYVRTTDSPTFANVTATGSITAGGAITAGWGVETWGCSPAGAIARAAYTIADGWAYNGKPLYCQSSGTWKAVSGGGVIASGGVTQLWKAVAGQTIGCTSGNYRAEARVDANGVYYSRAGDLGWGGDTGWVVGAFVLTPSNPDAWFSANVIARTTLAGVILEVGTTASNIVPRCEARWM